MPPQEHYQVVGLGTFATSAEVANVPSPTKPEPPAEPEAQPEEESAP